IRGEGGGPIQVCLRLSFELFHARGTAEVVLLPGMLVDMLSGGGIHVHPTNRVTLESGNGIRRSHVRLRTYARKLSCLIADALYWIHPADRPGNSEMIIARGLDL